MSNKIIQDKHSQVDTIITALESVDRHSDEALKNYQEIIKLYDTLEFERDPEVIAWQQTIISININSRKGGEPGKMHEQMQYATRSLANCLYSRARDISVVHVPFVLWDVPSGE
jgi:hypothetical protein